MGRIILEYGSDEQKNRYLPQIVSGETTAAIALSEPEAESDVARITTRAEKRKEQYVISGRKSFVDLADVAEFITLFARNELPFSTNIENINVRTIATMPTARASVLIFFKSVFPFGTVAQLVNGTALLEACGTA